MAYPNPTSGIVHVQTEGQSMVEVQVFDLFGKMLFQQSVGKDDFSVDLSNFSSGTYLLRIISDKGVETVKVVRD